jgi:hypothetical protein
VAATNGTLTITPGALTVVADNATRPYGQANPAFTGTLSGLRNAENITATYATAATTASPAGTYDIIPSLADPDGKLGNYTVASTTGTLTVGKVQLTVTADNQTRLYGAPNAVLTATYSGFVAGDDSSVLSGQPNLSTIAGAASTVAGGPYPIQVSQGTLAAANYDFLFSPGLLTITQASSLAALASSANPASTGSTLTLTATLSALAPSAGVPSGPVQFFADGAPLGAPATLASGSAALTTSSLSHGIHTLAVGYGGDGNFVGSSNTLASSQVIDCLPVATLATYTRDSNAWSQIAIPDLMTNHVSDADGDPLALVSVSSGRNGATVLLFGGYIYYLPSNTDPNRNATDSLDYVVSDGFPGGNVTGQIQVKLNAPATAAPAALTRLTAGPAGVALSFTGSPNSTYHLERTSALRPSGTTWTNLGTAATDTAGQGSFTDTNAPAGQGYYRAVWP